MEHRNPKDRDRAILWAQKVLFNKGQYVILDTETTGLNRNDVIVQIAIIDLDGNELLNTLVKPTKRKRISPDATAIHGIRISDLNDSPTFAEIFPNIKKIIEQKTVIIYNAEYDEKLIDQTLEQDECNCASIRTECAMLKYSEFIGKWSDYHYSYTYQKLPGGDHTAVGDCYATLKLVNKMASSNLTTINPSDINLVTQKITPDINISQIKKWWEIWK